MFEDLAKLQAVSWPSHLIKTLTLRAGAGWAKQAQHGSKDGPGGDTGQEAATSATGARRTAHTAAAADARSTNRN